MKAEVLTAKQVEFTKPDPDKRIELPAGPPKGLYLVVHPTGRKSWAFRYRFNKKTHKLTYGEYPAVGLAAARAEAESAAADLRDGKNPANTKADEDAAKEAEGTVEAQRQESVKSVV